MRGVAAAGRDNSPVCRNMSGNVWGYEREKIGNFGKFRISSQVSTSFVSDGQVLKYAAKCNCKVIITDDRCCNFTGNPAMRYGCSDLCGTIC